MLARSRSAALLVACDSSAERTHPHPHTSLHCGVVGMRNLGCRGEGRARLSGYGSVVALAASPPPVRPLVYRVVGTAFQHTSYQLLTGCTAQCCWGYAVAVRCTSYNRLTAPTPTPQYDEV